MGGGSSATVAAQYPHRYVTGARTLMINEPNAPYSSSVIKHKKKLFNRWATLSNSNSVDGGLSSLSSLGGNTTPPMSPAQFTGRSTSGPATVAPFSRATNNSFQSSSSTTSGSDSGLTCEWMTWRWCRIGILEPWRRRINEPLYACRGVHIYGMSDSSTWLPLPYPRDMSRNPQIDDDQLLHGCGPHHYNNHRSWLKRRTHAIVMPTNQWQILGLAATGSLLAMIVYERNANSFIEIWDTSPPAPVLPRLLYCIPFPNPDHFFFFFVPPWTNHMTHVVYAPWLVAVRSLRSHCRTVCWSLHQHSDYNDDTLRMMSLTGSGSGLSGSNGNGGSKSSTPSSPTPPRVTDGPASTTVPGVRKSVANLVPLHPPPEMVLLDDQDHGVHTYDIRLVGRATASATFSPPSSATSSPRSTLSTIVSARGQDGKMVQQMVMIDDYGNEEDIEQGPMVVGIIEDRLKTWRFRTKRPMSVMQALLQPPASSSPPHPYRPLTTVTAPPQPVVAVAPPVVVGPAAAAPAVAPVPMIIPSPATPRTVVMRDLPGTIRYAIPVGDGTSLLYGRTGDTPSIIDVRTGTRYDLVNIITLLRDHADRCLHLATDPSSHGNNSHHHNNHGGGHMHMHLERSASATPSPSRPSSTIPDDHMLIDSAPRCLWSPPDAFIHDRWLVWSMTTTPASQCRPPYMSRPSDEISRHILVLDWWRIRNHAQLTWPELMARLRTEAYSSHATTTMASASSSSVPVMTRLFLPTDYRIMSTPCPYIGIWCGTSNGLLLKRPAVITLPNDNSSHSTIGNQPSRTWTTQLCFWTIRPAYFTDALAPVTLSTASSSSSSSSSSAYGHHHNSRHRGWVHLLLENEGERYPLGPDRYFPPDIQYAPSLQRVISSATVVTDVTITMDIRLTSDHNGHVTMLTLLTERWRKLRRVWVLNHLPPPPLPLIDDHLLPEVQPAVPNLLVSDDEVRPFHEPLPTHDHHHPPTTQHGGAPSGMVMMDYLPPTMQYMDEFPGDVFMPPSIPCGSLYNYIRLQCESLLTNCPASLIAIICAYTL